jgi:hypothetical protein
MLFDGAALTDHAAAYRITEVVLRKRERAACATVARQASAARTLEMAPVDAVAL